MPTYVFKGRNRLNEIIVGERVAENREALRQILRREQVTLTSVKEKGREIGIPKIGGRKRKVKAKDLSIFTRQFSVMIDAGLPLVQCLDILAQQQDNKFFQQTLLQVRQDVEEGSTLAAKAGGIQAILGGDEEVLQRCIARIWLQADRTAEVERLSWGGEGFAATWRDGKARGWQAAVAEALPA